LPLFLLLLALLLVGCDAEQAKAPSTPEPARDGPQVTGRIDRSQAGTPAPEAEFENPEGEAASFADFRGKPLLVNLWATWCAPCIAEMPTLDALAAAEPGLQVLALSQDLNGQQKVDAFFEQRNFAKLEPYIDPELRLMGELKVQSLPTTILYDARGREVWRMTGMENWQGPRARRLIAEAFKS
jgi:thiol-disulfide isomerase/thioredoxin